MNKFIPPISAKEAVELSIEKWGILATTGENRRWIVGTTQPSMPYGCGLCYYAGQSNSALKGISRRKCRTRCPYALKFGCCCNRSSPYHGWEEAQSDERRKYYAALFLEQLKQLLEVK